MKWASQNPVINGIVAVGGLVLAIVGVVVSAPVIASVVTVAGIVLAAIVLGLYVVFYHKIFAITFDENFARATGVKAGWYNVLIALLTAVTIVLGMRLMGALLISSLVIFPALTSMRIFKSFRSVVICSAILSVSCFLIGIFVSYAWSTPAGASVVCVNIAAFFLFWAASLLLGCRKANKK